jgi:hypothetical protein
MSGDARWLVGWHRQNLAKREEPDLVTVWETVNGKAHLALELPKFMSDIAISSENHRLAVLSGNDLFIFWDLLTGKKLTSVRRQL